MVIVPDEQLTGTDSSIFSGNGTREGFSSLLEGAEHGFNQASFPETLRA